MDRLKYERLKKYAHRFWNAEVAMQRVVSEADKGAWTYRDANGGYHYIGTYALPSEDEKERTFAEIARRKLSHIVPFVNEAKAKVPAFTALSADATEDEAADALLFMLTHKVDLSNVNERY